MEVMTSAQLDALVPELPAWRLVDNALELEHTFQNFRQAWSFLSQLALLSEQLNHHAAIYNVYGYIKLRLWTHDSGGITEKDIALARHLQALF